MRTATAATSARRPRAAREDRLADIRFRLFHPDRLHARFADRGRGGGRRGARRSSPSKTSSTAFGRTRTSPASRVALFSRTLDEVTGQFPEVAAALAAVPGEFLLDGEIVAWRKTERRPDSFFRLQRRLGRKAPAAELLAEIPAAFIAYDCLAIGSAAALRRAVDDSGASASKRSRRHRRETAPVSTSSAPPPSEELERAFGAARARGNEGLMLKRMDSVLSGRQAGQALAQVEEGGGDPRRRRDRRRAGTRQARRDALGLHLRRA